MKTAYGLRWSFQPIQKIRCCLNRSQDSLTLEDSWFACCIWSKCHLLSFRICIRTNSRNRLHIRSEVSMHFRSSFRIVLQSYALTGVAKLSEACMDLTRAFTLDRMSWNSTTIYTSDRLTITSLPEWSSSTRTKFIQWSSRWSVKLPNQSSKHLLRLRLENPIQFLKSN